jgi:enamine deaminase RidA (YjgF/YER057c/UK114 family)
VGSIVDPFPGENMPGAVTLIRSAQLSDVAQYAYAATAPATSRLIFLAGACPLNEDGSTAAVGDYAGQAAKAVENLKVALADSGASLDDVIMTRVLVASTRQKDLVTAWEVVRDAFGDHDVPSTLMGVTVLGYQDQLVEVEAVAAVLDPPETHVGVR